MRPILTIAIPTYNRSGHLSQLLEVLYREVRPLVHQIDVLVSDNASSDDTPEVISSMTRRWPELITQRNATNVGPDRNFCLMVERVEASYFWIIGDDDVPKLGALARILNVLVREEPALLYMQSDWQKVVDPKTSTRDEIAYRVLDREGFARAVHIWTTFISGMVVKRSVLVGHDMRRYVGTFLVQLGWVLPALAGSNRFVVVEDACVVATQDNSGGYGVLTVFGTSFPRIAREFFSRQPDLAEQLIDASIKRALPALIWATRENPTAASSGEVPWGQIRKLLGRKLRFWLILLPLGVAPRPIAHRLNQALQLADRLRAKVSRKFHGQSQTEGLKSIGAFLTDIP